MPRRHGLPGRQFAPAILTVFVVIGCYAKGFSAPRFLPDEFALWQGTWSVWDDPFGVFRIWGGEIHPSEMHMRPVADTFAWAAMQLWGENAVGWRVFGVLLHSVTVMFAVSVFRTLRFPGPEWLGLVIACHPLFAQQIMWTAQYRSAIASLFLVAAVWAFVQFHVRESVRWGVLGLTLSALAVLSKSSAVALPALLVLLAAACRARPSRRVWAFFAASVVVVAACGAVDFLVVEQGPHPTVTWSQRIESTYLGFLQGWRNLLIPEPLAFTYEFDVSVVEVLCAAAIVPAFVLLWRHRGRWQAAQLLLVVAMFLVIIGPVVASPVFALLVSPIQDRYVCLGVFVIVPYVGHLLGPVMREGSRARPYVRAALAASILVLCAATVRQASLYTDVHRFYGEAAGVTPHNIDLRMFWAISLREEGRYDEAVRVLGDATALIADATQRRRGPSAPAQYKRYDDMYLPQTEMGIANERAQVDLARGITNGVLGGLPPVEVPDVRMMLGFPVSAIHAAIRLESPDLSVRDEREGARILARAALEQVALESTLHEDRRAWCRLRLQVLYASGHAAGGQFEPAQQLIAKVLADPRMTGPGQRRARLRDDLRRRLDAYQQRRPFHNPQSQMLWRQTTWNFLLW